MNTHGKIHWTELNTHNVEKAKAFYAETLGWTFSAMPMPDGPYWIIKQGEHTVGGIFNLAKPDFAGIPDSWLTYIAVDDIDARIALAEEHGGKIMREPFDVPGIGRIAIVADAVGAVSGWMTPAEQQG